MSIPIFDLTDRVAIVTGGSRSIGRAIALGFAEAGADVVIASRTLPDLEEVAGLISDLGRQSLAVVADVSKADDVDNMVNKTMERFGKIDILVNNAGMTGNITKTEELSKEDWDRILGLNLTGAFLCSQAVGRVMIKQNRGKIINLSSVGSQVALPRLAAYCASKGGIEQLTKVLAVDWVKYNIHVNALGASYIETDMISVLKSSKTIYEDIIRKTPMGRWGQPEELVGAAIFLASDASNYMTGQTLWIDGGWLAL